MERQSISTLSKISLRWFVPLFCLVTLLQTGIAIAAQSVVLIASPENSAHQMFTASFREKLTQLKPGLDIVEQSLDEYVPSPGRLVVTLGSHAFKETIHQPGTMFHALISDRLYREYYPEDKAGKYHQEFSQPVKKMLQLHSLVLPHSRDVGVLLSNSNLRLINELKQQAIIARKRVVIENVGDDFSESLSNLLPKIDSLLLFPDAKVINRSTINSLVLDSYHKKIPLVGYSRSLVKAGAMMALYSTPTQLGEDAAQTVSRVISGKRVPIHNYPKQFNVSVNYKLSRAYGITIPSEKELHDQLVSGRRK